MISVITVYEHMVNIKWDMITSWMKLLMLNYNTWNSFTVCKQTDLKPIKKLGYL